MSNQRWWFVSAIATIIALVGTLLSLWLPLRWSWIPILALIVFVVVCHFNPACWYRRRAQIAMAIASATTLAPGIELVVQWDPDTLGELVVETGWPAIVLPWLAAMWFGWLDYMSRRPVAKPPAELQNPQESFAPINQEQTGIKGNVHAGQVHIHLSQKAEPVRDDIAQRLPAEAARAPFDPLPRAQAGQLFGRDTQLEDLISRLQKRQDVCVWGPAGFGKTALAAEALFRLFPQGEQDLSDSPYPDGIVFLDLYRLKAAPEKVWHFLADRFAPTRAANLAANDRATGACTGRKALVVVEGAEEAGKGQTLQQLLSVLAPTITRLILTRDKDQIFYAQPIQLDAELMKPDALALLRKLSNDQVNEDILNSVLTILGGHPLALTWAGCQLELREEPATYFLEALQQSPLPRIHEPGYEDHTVKWLYNRTVQRLDHNACQVLSGAALLAAAPFGLGAAMAGLANGKAGSDQTEDRAKHALKQLVRRGLLRVSTTTDNSWEFTHALAARFANNANNADTNLIRALCSWVLTAFGQGASHYRKTSDFSLLQVATLHATMLL